MLAHPEEGMQRAAKVITAANRSNADALVLSCPLCEYNLGTRQPGVIASSEGISAVPTYYFSQLLGIALGLDQELWRLDLNGEAARSLLAERKLIAAVSA
jgi:heterodisulfide reductase subunit B